jgi:starch synthase
MTRAERLTGILNGLDLERWNPATDRALYQRFQAADLPKRKRNKAGLLKDLGLDPRSDLPLLAMVTRLDLQKGVDLALDALQWMPRQDWQFVLLGKGDSGLEERALAFASANTERVRSVLRYDDRLARCLYGGADALLVPSRYEPCGLTQMIAMRYGCLPIVRATGGLRDTVSEGEHGTGFLVDGSTPEDLRAAIDRALTTWRDPERWRRMQDSAMAKDFSWDRSAEMYIQTYERAVGAARSGG